jgi:hypothetical protein
MKRNNIYVCISILLFVTLFSSLSGAALPHESGKERIVGYWFGVYQQVGVDGDVQEICHIKADGSFLIRFRIVQDGHPVGEQSESGRWEVKDNIKTMVTTHINGKQLGGSEYITEKYRITKLTDSEMNYEHIKTGKAFKLTRVGEGFKLP